MNTQHTAVDTVRPVLHYTARNTWLNDPNGLIFHDGLYHLYYQNNPLGSTWGNMSWGHATSEDLVLWTEQDVAIRVDAEEEIFSGSIVFDSYNTSSLGTPLQPPLIAIYTSAYTKESPLFGFQAQSLAYSIDGGFTWEKYANNPVLNRNSANFRDPKVFRYNTGTESFWVMVAVEAAEHTVVLYRSADLKSWQYLSSFGPANATGGIWECPDLFPLTLDGDPAKVKWVLSVNMNPGGPNGGSAGQYFVGDFDGKTFTSETTVVTGVKSQEQLESYQWLDWGRDYYAAVSFNDAPDGRRIMVGWMNNWDYAKETPTGPWRSQMALPREVELATVDGQPRLIQRPVVEISAHFGREPLLSCSATPIAEGTHPLEANGPVLLLEAEFTAGTATEFGFIVRKGATEGTRIGLSPVRGLISVDRTYSGQVDFHSTFPSIDTAPIVETGGKYTLTVAVDHYSVEVFTQGGEVSLAELIFPMAESAGVSIYSKGGTATLEKLRISAPTGLEPPR
ncbi:MAG: glycoside hydrolase family 32 protein [Acidobacteria bacterium]|nr:glycoside hydrolase family 32 protein [Acidobacteriota bacterium]